MAPSMKLFLPPKYLLPRGQSLLYRNTNGLPRIAHSAVPRCQYASKSESSSKPRVLEKPAKFNPPSHSARLPRRPRQYPGAPISTAQWKEQETKQYPALFPPEGTFMFWFLTNRMVHMWICLSVLFSLTIFTAYKEFHRKTAFNDMLPRGREFFSHPWEFAKQYGRVYKLHTDYVSMETAEKRKKTVDDVEKWRRYRRAHGLEKGGDDEVLGGWTVKGNGQLVGPTIETIPDVRSDAESSTEVLDAGELPLEEEAPRRRRKPVKRWFGIWE